HEIERGFYKSTAAVYLGAGVLAHAGRLALLLRPAEAAAAATSHTLELLCWGASLAAAAIYLWSLWGDQYRLRARAYVAAWMSGVVALSLGAQAYRLSPMLSVETVLYPVSFMISALVLGSVTAGMLLGHWYLIDRELSIDPFRRILRFFVVMLAAQAGLLLIS